MDEDEYMTPLAVAAHSMKEMFDALVQAGFTEDQAVKVIAYNLAAHREGHNE